VNPIPAAMMTPAAFAINSFLPASLLSLLSPDAGPAGALAIASYCEQAALICKLQTEVLRVQLPSLKSLNSFYRTGTRFYISAV
jgi:hypothetical protein